MAQDNTPLNPVQIEAELINASNSVAKSIQPVSDAYNEWQQAKLNFKRAYAIAYLDATGSVEDRKQIATRDTLPAADEKNERVAAKIESAGTVDELRALWAQASPELQKRITARVEDLNGGNGNG